MKNKKNRIKMALATLSLAALAMCQWSTPAQAQGLLSTIKNQLANNYLNNNLYNNLNNNWTGGYGNPQNYGYLGNNLPYGANNGYGYGNYNNYCGNGAGWQNGASTIYGALGQRLADNYGYNYGYNSGYGNGLNNGYYNQGGLIPAVTNSINQYGYVNGIRSLLGI